MEPVFFLYDTDDQKFIAVFDGLTLGRLKGHEVYPEDSKMSPSHASFAVRAEGAFVEDLKSATKIRLNGREIASGAPYRIKTGDELSVGSRSFIVTNQDQRPPAGAPLPRAGMRRSAAKRAAFAVPAGVKAWNAAFSDVAVQVVLMTGALPLAAYYFWQFSYSIGGQGLPEAPGTLMIRILGVLTLAALSASALGMFLARKLGIRGAQKWVNVAGAWGAFWLLALAGDLGLQARERLAWNEIGKPCLARFDRGECLAARQQEAAAYRSLPREVRQKIDEKLAGTDRAPASRGDTAPPVVFPGPESVQVVPQAPEFKSE